MVCMDDGQMQSTRKHMTEENITLFYQNGSSNKVYQASLKAQGDAFVVNFAYGRVGQTLRTGTKTEQPVDAAKAKTIFDKLVKAKTSKGYRPEAGSKPSDYVLELEARQTDHFPQLLNPIDDVQLDEFMLNDDFVMQEKHDGVRLTLWKKDGVVIGINKKGLTTSVANTIVRSMADIPDMTMIDGEAVGDHYYAFDLLELRGNNYRSDHFLQRHTQLALLGETVCDTFGPHIHISEVACHTNNKTKMLNDCRARNAEGVVFKKILAPYVPGRPASGGDQIKHKFYKTASAIVSGHNDKRSVQIQLLDGQNKVDIGNVTIPPSCSVPAIGAVIEVKYLYCFEGGSLYQPTFLVERNDVDTDECTVDQLVFKAKDVV